MEDDDVRKRRVCGNLLQELGERTNAASGGADPDHQRRRLIVDRLRR
jgi:hypothetical protein